MFTEDKSREKQRSPAKTTLIAPELAQKGSLSKPLKPWQGFHCFDKVGTALVRNRPQQNQSSQIYLMMRKMKLKQYW